MWSSDTHAHHRIFQCKMADPVVSFSFFGTSSVIQRDLRLRIDGLVFSARRTASQAPPKHDHCRVFVSLRQLYCSLESSVSSASKTTRAAILSTSKSRDSQKWVYKNYTSLYNFTSLREICSLDLGVSRARVSQNSLSLKNPSWRHQLSNATQGIRSAGSL